MKFLKLFLASTVGTIVGLFLFSLLFILIIVAVGSSASMKKTVTIDDPSVLHLSFKSPLVERAIEDPFAKAIMGPGAEKIGLIELKEAINYAKEDEKITGIFLEQGLSSMGMAKMQELRATLKKFKESGKFIVSYGEFMTEGQYYLASVADDVYVNPQGMFEFNGLNAEVLFFKGMLDKIGVKAQVFRPESNKYKGAVEPFIRTDMSEESKEQTTALLTSIYDNYLSKIADGRNIAKDELRKISNEMLARTTGEAVSFKLIDDTLYFDQVIDELKVKSDLADDAKVNLVNLSDYRNSYSLERKPRENQVAVIIATGSIVSGEGDDESIGSDKFAKEIREARLNDKVKAIVLRINSGGGSALASDVMWRELELASKVKPVIASMSDVAASGGYYMAMACDTIVAEPMTITGSIGIFAMIPDLSGMMEDKIGITTDRISTGELSNLYTVTRSLSDFEKSVIQKSINEGYENFTGKAAQGRSMSQAAIKKVGGGRVWTGEQAKELGLVDVLGGLEEAIEIAAQKANLEEYRINYYPKQMELVEQILSDLGASAKTSFAKAELGDLYPYLEKAREIKTMQGPQMRMPFEIEIK